MRKKKPSNETGRRAGIFFGWGTFLHISTEYNALTVWHFLMAYIFGRKKAQMGEDRMEAEERWGGQDWER